MHPYEHNIHVMLLPQHRDIQCHRDERDYLKKKEKKNNTQNIFTLYFYIYGERFYMSARVNECVCREIEK